jgi:hypothetical protein
MILFYNIDLLEKETKGDPHYMVVALQRWFNKDLVPKNAKEKYKPLSKSLYGSSFLSKPEPFFEDTTTDIIWRIQYLKVAAKRDYTLYKLYRLTHLDRTFVPDLNINAIQANPLLIITDKNIYFKYEENNGTFI